MRQIIKARRAVAALLLLGVATTGCILFQPRDLPSPAQSNASVGESAPPPSVGIPRESVIGPGPSPTPEVPPPRE
jgi:hypothetical protein